MVRLGFGTIDFSVASYMRPMPWQRGQAPSGVLVENDSASRRSRPLGYCPAREYSMRSRFDNVVTLPTDERVVGEPRCCCRATAGGRPSMESTCVTDIW